MDDATAGLTELLNYSTDMNTSMNSVAPSIAAALLGIALIFVVWALATKNAKCTYIPDSLGSMRNIYYHIYHLSL